MDELKRIKERIFEEEKIETLLDLLDCEGVDTEQRGMLFIAALPNGDNPRSVQVKNNASLSSSIRSKGVDGDIYDIVSYIVYEARSKEDFSNSLHKSKYWICNKLGYLEFVDEFYRATSIEEDVKYYNDWLKKIPKAKPKVEIPKNETIDSKMIERYGQYPYYNWIKEGINSSTQKEFGVGIDVMSERITFPVHNKDGQLIGLKGRYCGKDERVEKLYKYLYILPCNKSYEFFNLFRAMPFILEKKEVIIVEGAKTVMILWQWGYKNAISIEGDSITSVQIELLKEMGIDIKFIFMWDKDKDKEFIYEEVQKLQGRLRYALWDKENVLSGKDSPCDKGKFIFEKLLKESVYRV